MRHPFVYLIAAVGNSGQLGHEGRLPWSDREDLLWFRSMTMNQRLVVGYRTQLTLPPLPGREVILCRQDPAAQIVELDPNAQRPIWIAGGEKTYRLWLPFVARFFISRIDYTGPADTYMPTLWDPFSD